MSGLERLSMAAVIGVALLAGAPHARAADEDPAADAGPSPAVPSRPLPSVELPFRLEAVGGAAFGNTTLATGETVNAYGPGLALRGAYAFDFGGTLGLRVDHYFGSTSSYPVPLVALIEHQTGASFAGADVGFELPVSHALFRPHVGLGLLGLHQHVQCSPVSGSFDDLANQLCEDNDEGSTTWSLSAVPGLLMGLGWSRYYGFVDMQYYFSGEADAFAIAGGAGVTL